METNVTYILRQINGADFKNNVKNSIRAMIYYLLIIKSYINELFMKNNITYVLKQINGVDYM